MWLIALLPWFAIIFWLKSRARTQTLIAPHLAKAMGVQGATLNRRRFALIALSGVVAIVALSGPSFHALERPSFANTSARVVVMDMSMSMYATDIKPNRLTQARYKVTDLLSHWQEGSTGLVAYAGDAYMVSPMTSDANTIANLVPNLSPELMPYPGANAASGIKLAIEMMQNTGLATGHIVLVTDDIDDTERNTIESLLSNSNWHLSILGIGSRAGAPIKLDNGSLMTLDNGQPVVAKSNFTNMQTLAFETGGQFVPVQVTNNDVLQIARSTSQVDETSATKSDQMIEERINQGFWLIPLLIIPALLMFRRGVFFAVALAVLPLAHSPSAQASPWLTKDQQAMQHFENKQYQQAADLFEDPNWKGIAQYESGDYQGAAETLAPLSSPQAMYNRANALAQLGNYQDAIDLYESVLKQEPDNQDARTNLERVKERLQQQGDSSQSPEQNNQNAQQNLSSSEQEEGQQTPSEQQSNPEQASDTDEPQQQSTQEEKNQPQQGEQAQDDQDGMQQSKPSGQQEDKSQGQQEDSEQSQQSQAQPSSNDPQTESDALAADLSQDNQQPIDPELRKLQQVEAARDPSRLLRAQMLLQAQQKQPPQQTGKKW
ncbi:TPR repeat-containing protein [Vibrio sp. 16]|nr:TPR repeat-containing protein [Vibrio sp. 16]